MPGSYSGMAFFPVVICALAVAACMAAHRISLVSRSLAAEDFSVHGARAGRSGRRMVVAEFMSQPRNTMWLTNRLGGAMASIDVDALRDELRDLAGGSWSMGHDLGLGALAEVDGLDDIALCRLAEDMGFDLRDFELDQ